MAPGQDVHDMSYYGKCMIGGILSCGITHTVICPMDIVKCRKQVPISHSLLLPILTISIHVGQPDTVQEHWRWFQHNLQNRRPYWLQSRKFYSLWSSNLYPHRAGFQLSLVILHRALESSDSMKSSKTSTRTCSGQVLPSTKLLVSCYLQPALKSLPTACSVHLKL